MSARLLSLLCGMAFLTAISGTSSALESNADKLTEACHVVQSLPVRSRTFEALDVQRLAWLLVWIGENETSPDSALDTSLCRLQDSCGNIALPYFVCFDVDRKYFLVQIASEIWTADTIQSGVMTGLVNQGNTLASLVDRAKQLINHRTGYKFNEHKYVVPQ